MGVCKIWHGGERKGHAPARFGSHLLHAPACTITFLSAHADWESRHYKVLLSGEEAIYLNLPLFNREEL